MTSGDQPMNDWLLGIDAGLTTIKAILFTPDGQEVAIADRRTPERRPEPDRREVVLGELWETVSGIVRDVIDSGPASPADVAAVGVAGHGHGLYVLNADGEPLRPGIKSTDSRATDLVAEWEDDGTAAKMHQRLGYSPFAADPLSLLRWLKEHEPDTYGQIDRLLFCKDYLKYRLTGHLCTDEMEASVYCDPRSGEYDHEVFRILNLESCIDALPDVVPSWQVCGRVSATAAAETGLAEGTPVASGLHDVGATALGVGAHEPNQGVLIIGTWGQSIVVCDEPATPDATATNDTTATPGLTRQFLESGWLRYKGNRSAAACVDWFVREVGREWRERADAEGIDPYDLYNRVVEAVPAGANGLLFHPYLSGSTDDPTDRGGFYGLTTDHTKEDMLRAIYEGVAIAQTLRLAELAPPDGLRDVRLGGGGARSDVWSDIFAAALDEEITVPVGEEAGARGAAICAAIAAGIHPDHETAVDRMVSIRRRHRPDPDVTAVYRERRDIFADALPAIRPTWKRLSEDAHDSTTNDE